MTTKMNRLCGRRPKCQRPSSKAPGIAAENAIGAGMDLFPATL